MTSTKSLKPAALGWRRRTADRFVVTHPFPASGVGPHLSDRRMTSPPDEELPEPSIPALPAGIFGLRIGNGFDIHRFAPPGERHLILGGVVFEGHPGLVGHSDGDAVAHACADAMLGATGNGDIGQHFADTDDRWKGADSIDLLAHVRDILQVEGFRVINIDCSVVCESPKLAPAKDDMQARLSAAAGGPVTVKGRRAEGLGPIGEGLGIVVYASALLATVNESKGMVP